MQKKVLMACCNYWDSPFHVGSHQIAKVFLKWGWKVAFVSSPISPLHYLKRDNKEDLKIRFNNWKKNGVWEYEYNLYNYVPGALFTPANKKILDSMWMHKNWYKFSYLNVVEQLKREGFGDVDILYIDNLYQSFWLDKINYKKSILRIADKNSGFKSSTKSAEKIEQYIAKKVDCVVYSARSLKSTIDELSPQKSYLLSNGVDFEHFYIANKDCPTDLLNIPKPIALYVGAMNEWFDLEGIIYISKKLSNVSFVFIGNDELIKNKSKLPSNMYFLGRKQYNEIPAYIYNSNLGIIPFNVKDYPDLVNNINPLKLYEYMSCGLPVVSTRWKELENLKTPALLCDTIIDFIDNINNVLSNQVEKDIYINFAKNNTWESKLKLFFKEAL